MSSNKVLITLGLLWIFFIITMGFSTGNKIEAKKLEQEKQQLQSENSELQKQLTPMELK